MAIFLTTNSSAKQLKKQNFRNEKELQAFVEQNMESFFGIRFLASEFTTSKQHGGRIDSLGLDENNSPVIIEYKWGEKDNIINQGLFYLDWLVDHKGDFQLLVQKKLGKDIEVDFGSPRVLLIAQTFC
jgi:RecB family endonuclease NucS